MPARSRIVELTPKLDFISLFAGIACVAFSDYARDEKKARLQLVILRETFVHTLQSTLHLPIIAIGACNACTHIRMCRGNVKRD